MSESALDAIEAKWGDQWHMAPKDLKALAAEVRALRAEVEDWKAAWRER